MTTITLTCQCSEMPNTAREAIAAEVRAELARQNKTQRDVATVLGLRQSGISLRMQGKRSFRAEELTSLAEWLGVPVSRFMDSEVTA